MQVFRSLLAASGLGGGYVIEGSGVFDGTSGYLSRTFTSEANHSGSIVLKRSELGTTQEIFGSGIQFNSSDQLIINGLTTTAVFRDPTAFLHIFWDNTGAWVNGTTLTGTGSYATAALTNPKIGGSTNFIDMYVALFAFGDGQSWTLSQVGEETDEGNWSILTHSFVGTGTDTFLIEGGTDMAAGTDSSGQGNNFTKSGTITATNDSPTNDAVNDYGNYCTWNPLEETGAGTYSNGNLTKAGTAAEWQGIGTLGMSSGKWYFEMTVTVYDGGNFYGVAGSGGNAIWATTERDLICYRLGTGNTYKADTGDTSYGLTAYGNTLTTNDVLGIAIDFDNDAIWFSKNGTWQNSATIGEVEAGTTTNAAYTSGIAGKTLFPAFGDQSGATGTCTLNTGQTAFAYTQPTGYSALATHNFPAPAILDPAEHYHQEIVTHDGTSTAKTCSFDLDTYEWLCEIKNLDTAEKWYVINSLRGSNKYYSHDASTQETTDANVLSVSGTTFTLGSTLLVDDYDVVFHKAGLASATASNTDGTINTVATSANTTSGFFMSEFTGTGANATVGHGLDSAPEYVVDKNLSDGAGQHALAWHIGLTSGTYDLVPGTTAAESSNPTAWNSTAPTGGVVSVGANQNTNRSGYTHFMYGWHSVEGYSAFKRHTGNSSADGPAVYAAGLPAEVTIKRISTTGGMTRFYKSQNLYNVASNFLYVYDTVATQTSADQKLDFLSTGMKVRGAGAWINGGTFITSQIGGIPIQGDGESPTQGRAR
jgi:hypothetical protein